MILHSSRHLHIIYFAAAIIIKVLACPTLWTCSLYNYGPADACVHTIQLHASVNKSQYSSLQEEKEIWFCINFVTRCKFDLTHLVCKSFTVNDVEESVKSKRKIYHLPRETRVYNYIKVINDFVLHAFAQYILELGEPEVYDTLANFNSRALGIYL